MKSEKVRHISEASGLDAGKAESLAEQAFRSLRDAIFAGMYDPGEPLRELHLARMLEVSQATVREALVQLEQAGLVMREQNRRTTISSFSKQEVRERLELRRVLENMAAIGAAEHLEEKHFEELDRLALAIDDTIERGENHENVHADVRFHRMIWERSGNVVLAKTLLQVTTPLFAFRGILHQRGMKDLRQAKPHDRIVAALRSKESGRIRQEIEYHLAGQFQEYMDMSDPFVIQNSRILAAQAASA